MPAALSLSVRLACLSQPRCCLLTKSKSCLALDKDHGLGQRQHRRGLLNRSHWKQRLTPHPSGLSRAVWTFGRVRVIARSDNVNGLQLVCGGRIQMSSSRMLTRILSIGTCVGMRPRGLWSWLVALLLAQLVVQLQGQQVSYRPLLYACLTSQIMHISSIN